MGRAKERDGKIIEKIITNFNLFMLSTVWPLIKKDKYR